MPNLLDTLWQLQQQPDNDPNALFDQPDISADEGSIAFNCWSFQLNEEELGGWKIGMTSGESRDALESVCGLQASC